MKVARLFFQLSGEHETLPTSEVRAILDAEGYTYEVLEKLDQAVRLESSPSCAGRVKLRSAFTRFCGLEFFNCCAETGEIKKNMRALDLGGLLGEDESFAVRVVRVKNWAPDIDSMGLERKLGEVVLKKSPKTKVDLEEPDKIFFGSITGGRFVFGLKLAEIPTRPYVERSPSKKPFFHPSAMRAKLARCMVNLCRPGCEDLVFDPFCGTGSILIEAALIGCRVTGSDVKRRMARGASQNLAYFKIKPEGIFVADARSIPLKRVDCIVTDPPYGRSATTLKRPTTQIIEEVMISATELLMKGGKICMAAPKVLNVGDLGMSLGYKLLESHSVHVHRSLTREIALFQKV